MKSRILTLLLASALPLQNAMALDSGLSVDAGSFKLTQFDFKSLYNKYREAQPKTQPWAGSYFPFADKGIALKVEGIETSPAEKFDSLFKLKNQTTDYESQNHACDGLKGSTLEDCKGWYGHCNGWAGAAVKEPEPTTPITSGGIEYTVADQKAYLSEMWLDVNTMITGWSPKGDPTGDWVYKPNSKIAKKELADGVTNYDAFWDPSPRTFFLVLTNYIGVNHVGVVIDRFTGDAVWNQPLAGYSIDPIQASDLGQTKKAGKIIYTAKLTTTIYWASDEVEYDHVSSKFDIKKGDKNADDYVGRKLSYTLFFDTPVTLDDKGQIAKAGRMVGPGIWAHQEDPKAIEDVDQSHPDFMWIPTDFQAKSQYGNPLVTHERVYKLLKGGKPSEGGKADKDEAKDDASDEKPASDETADYVLKIKLSSFPDGASDREGRYFTDKLSRRLRDAGISSRFSASDLEVMSRFIKVPVTISSGQSIEQVYAALEDAGYERYGN